MISKVNSYYNMRENFIRKKVGEFISEYSVRNKQNEDIPVYSVTNSQGFCKDFFGKEVASEDKTTYKIVPYGYFAYNPSRINVGSVDCQLKEDRVIVSPLYNVIKLSEALNNRFFLYYLKSDSTMLLIKTYATGTVRSNLKVSILSDFPIYVPPLSEQQQIVEELDLLSGVIEKKKEQLKELDNLAQSIFYEMFGDPVANEKGWEISTLDEICTNIVDCPHSTPKKVDYATNFPCIRTSELKGGNVSWDTMQYLDEEEYNIRISRLKPLAGDIVFGREGTIGDAVVLPDGYNFSLGQRTMLLRVDTTLVSNIFLHRTIMSDWIRHQIDFVNVSSTVAHVNIKDFKKFIVPVPPLPLQQSFASKIEAIEKQKALIKQSITETETLFNSRMDYYFG